MENIRFLSERFFKLQKFKTFLLLRDIVTYVRQIFAGGKNIESVKKEETAMAKLAKDQLVQFNSDDYESGKSQFEAKFIRNNGYRQTERCSSNYK